MAKANIGLHNGRKLSFELNTLTKHCVVLGTTGSGKTVMGKVLMEEALQRGIPIIAIDPKGDIGGLGVANRDFDFRPFIGTGLKKSEKTALEYKKSLKYFGISVEGATKLSKIKTTIYTPKSTAGVSVSLIPDLSAPKNFKKLSEDDPNFIADFVEPVSASVLQLAGVTGSRKEKAQSLISSILVHYWNDQRNMTVERLIQDVIAPPFETIGSLSLEDFLNEKERKKLASAINLLLSSPAKKAWKHGEKLDMKKLMAPSTLSVFDLRFTINNDEKQFVAEQIMQEIYKFLINKGGSQRLKYILYIDELAGLLPPPPANPPSKKLLELLIRQARAFGLGIVVATQSPGDIDYRIIGNIGTRFIGRLRTDRDVEKVATAMDASASKLKSDLSKLKTGDFIYNNAVSNTSKLMKARWLLTYHAGPLKGPQIGWVNDPKTKPKVDGKIKVSAPRVVAVKTKKQTPKKRTYTRADTIVKAATIKRTKKKKTKERQELKRMKKTSKQTVTRILQQIRNHADKTQLKVALSQNTNMVPHLRIVVEPKKVNGINFKLQGPFVFDLTARIIPIHNYLKHVTWSHNVDDDTVIDKPKRSIVKAFQYAIREARHELKTKVYTSTVLKVNSFDRDEIEQKNYQHMIREIVPKYRQLFDKQQKLIKELKENISQNNVKIKKYRTKVKADKATRLIKRVLTKKKIAKSTVQMRFYEKRIRTVEGQNSKLRKRIQITNAEYEKRKKALKDKAFVKAHQCVKRFVYNPSRRDLIVHATLLLVPKRISEV